ncbi:MAG: YdjY domain-containing protein [Planctomycetota bacterium]|jgi:hypothetical protein
MGERRGRLHALGPAALAGVALWALACAKTEPGRGREAEEPAVSSAGTSVAAAEAAEEATAEKAQPQPLAVPRAEPIPSELTESAPLRAPTADVIAPTPAPQPEPVAAEADDPPISHPEVVPAAPEPADGPEPAAAPARDQPETAAGDAQSAPGEEGEKGEEQGDLITLARGLKINRRERHVDADAEVCLADGALELLVTTPEGKPHEAIFTLKPKPRQLHAALLILGLTAGAPGHYGVFGAEGDSVRISVVYEKDGDEVVVPVNELVVHNDTGEHLPDNVFVFAGSLLARAREGNRLIYAADVAGDVVSLVSFPDEVLALRDPASSENGMLMWSVDGSKLPDVGTAVVLRISPCEKDAPPAPEESADGERP